MGFHQDLIGKKILNYFLSKKPDDAKVQNLSYVPNIRWWPLTPANIWW